MEYFDFDAACGPDLPMEDDVAATMRRDVAFDSAPLPVIDMQDADLRPFLAFCPAPPELSNLADLLAASHATLLRRVKRLRPYELTSLSIILNFQKSFDPAEKIMLAIVTRLRTLLASNVPLDRLVSYNNTVYGGQPTSATRGASIERMMRLEFGDNVMNALLCTDADTNTSNWPEKVPDEVALSCCKDYMDAMCWRQPSVCASCARRRYGVHMTDVFVPNDGNSDYFCPLRLVDENVMRRVGADFAFDNTAIDGIMLAKDGVSDCDGGSLVTVCEGCYASLSSAKLPKYSLKNNLYRGELPERFRDLTWVEEMVCAVYRTMAHVTRILRSGAGTAPLVFHGNTCAHDLNIISTCTVLPRTPADILGCLAVVFVGPGPVDKDTMRQVFRIRKRKVWDFLLWLKDNNAIYAGLDIVLSEEQLRLYEDDDILPGLMQGVIHDVSDTVREVFEEETSGFQEHPGDGSAYDGEDDIPIVLEGMGVIDGKNDKLPGQAFTAAALRNLVHDASDSPDMLIPRGRAPVKEYNNPSLLPGQFPTIFPYGLGCFDDPTRPVPISFQKQAEYLLDTRDKLVRSHRFFIFVILNIYQRRLAHLHTYFTTRASDWPTVASQLIKLTPEVIRSVADHLENNHPDEQLSDVQREVFVLLKKVRTMASHIPGSEAAKLFMRCEIRSYMGYFGMPHIFLTMNPCAAHSPIFQVMVGDQQVDLMTRCPTLALARERAIRLFADPVAGAEFFEFSMECFLTKLLGWDPVTRRSTEKGGILGKIGAYFGSVESTDRGGLHCHLELWLDGGLNPSELHQRLLGDDDFSRRFFEFFEDTVRHALPNVDVPLEINYEPRTQMPPFPSNVSNWRDIFDSEIKMCGEALQRHVCKPVCHKYGHENDCRFQYPHEIVQSSFFDANTNSVYLACRDPTVVWYNPYILVFCRHNHDIRCILSGKAAKAAMFYITEYITKLDVKTYEMLTLLSNRVASMPKPDENQDAQQRAKLLLHKCLSQYTRQQQIHGQQAARYLRGLGDSIQSHRTVPMLSSLAVRHLKMLMDRNGVRDSDDIDCPSTELDEQDMHVRVRIGQDDRLVPATQVDDYVYRSDELKSMVFYDFVRFVRKEKMSDAHTENTSATRGRRAHPRYNIKDPHPDAKTHRLVRFGSNDGDGSNDTLVPRIIGQSIPRPHSKDYALFVVTHFCAWSVSCHPTSDDHVNRMLNEYPISEFHRRVLQNWDAVHECEDERDAERMRKQGQKTKPSRAFVDAVMLSTLDDETNEIPDLDRQPPQKKCDPYVESVVSRLAFSGWIRRSSGTSHTGRPSASATSDSVAKEWPIETTGKKIKEWLKHAKAQESVILQNRRSVYQPHQPESTTVAPTSDDVPAGHGTGARQMETAIQGRVALTMATTEEDILLDSAKLLGNFERKFSLNEKQTIAFRLVGRRFLDTINPTSSESLAVDEPLRMFMTGPGGTGKTWVVRALKALMEHFHQGHRIRYLAPTGGAAALIDGSTVHSGLGIHVAQKGRSRKGDEVMFGADNDWTVCVDMSKKEELYAEWRMVDFVFIDEVSMISQQLMCEIDYALRCAKGIDGPFGNTNMIFSGDLWQFQPVGGTPLYTPVLSDSAIRGKTTNSNIRARLGRLAWKTVNKVVEFEEQHRMRGDLEYASAVARLRRRRCTQVDVDLFNTRVIKSQAVPGGVTLAGDSPMNAATAIVPTNVLRETLNVRKATVEAGLGTYGQLVMCHAEDKADEKLVTDLDMRRSLLSLDTNSFDNGVLPGVIPLFEGMPVILRGYNLSTELKVTNGATGVLRQIFYRTDVHGLSIATCVLIEFPHSPVAIPGLPSGIYPVVPHMKSFETALTDKESGKKREVKVSRRQLPVQPAFAITGHSAQGQTLPCVVFDLRIGGFAGYVSASRATCREGICLLEPVTLDDINTNVPHYLQMEEERLSALAHNTTLYVNGTKTGYMEVPDTEDALCGSSKSELGKRKQNGAADSGERPGKSTRRRL